MDAQTIESLGNRVFIQSQVSLHRLLINYKGKDTLTMEKSYTQLTNSLPVMRQTGITFELTLECKLEALAPPPPHSKKSSYNSCLPLKLNNLLLTRSLTDNS